MMNNYELIQDILIMLSFCLTGLGSIVFLFWLLFKRGVPPYEQLRHNLHLNPNNSNKQPYKKAGSY